MPIENPFAVITPDRCSEFQEPTIDELAFDRCLRALTETRPWVLSFGILATIAAILTGIGICFLVVEIVFARSQDAGLLLAVIAVYACMLILYGQTARFLLGYSARIAKARVTKDMDDVADALEQQQRLWKTIGVMLIIWILLMLVLAGEMVLVQAGL